jgi:hypothetical protein
MQISSRQVKTDIIATNFAVTGKKERKEFETTDRYPDAVENTALAGPKF